MTVEELIEELQKIEDKSVKVFYESDCCLVEISEVSVYDEVILC